MQKLVGVYTNSKKKYETKKAETLKQEAKDKAKAKEKDARKN
jgi:hypothetical protein